MNLKTISKLLTAVFASLLFSCSDEGSSNSTNENSDSSVGEIKTGNIRDGRVIAPDGEAEGARGGRVNIGNTSSDSDTNEEAVALKTDSGLEESEDATDIDDVQAGDVVVGEGESGGNGVSGENIDFGNIDDSE